VTTGAGDEMNPKSGPDVLRPPLRRGVRWRRTLSVGCLAPVLLVCGGAGVLVAALQSGPVVLNLPAAGALKLGSNDVVLSNYTFQNGTSYFVDLNGSGVRNILELNYLEDTNSVEVVLHHSTRKVKAEHELLEWKMP
jgi:hypothetical protein